MAKSSQHPPTELAEFLPSLILGTATFNYQYNIDPYTLGTSKIVLRALESGIRAFDTSPYYGPSEELLGQALESGLFNTALLRKDVYILTKVGRISNDSFDYSREWVYHSVRRSCRRLKTSYLDVVYCHDVEFMSQEEVLTAVQELRRIRDQEGTVCFIGISGYPIKLLCELAEMILKETGEPLDIVQTYANFTLQNTTLLSQGLDRFVAAKVKIVTNASPLGMGLLRKDGVPVGGMGKWHPAPEPLIRECAAASQFVNSRSETLESVALRYSLENWALRGGSVGSSGYLITHDPLHQNPPRSREPSPLGVNVIGVSGVGELEMILNLWESIMDAVNTEQPHDTKTELSWIRRKKVLALASGIRDIFGKWYNWSWESPPAGFINKRGEFGLHADEIDGDAAGAKSSDQEVKTGEGQDLGLRTSVANDEQDASASF